MKFQNEKWGDMKEKEEVYSKSMANKEQKSKKKKTPKRPKKETKAAKAPEVQFEFKTALFFKKVIPSQIEKK